MRCVLDSNVGVKWLLQEDQSDKARRIRDEFVRGQHELLAPDIFTVECAHALTRAQRQGRVTPAEVNAFMADLLTSLPHFHPHEPLLPRASPSPSRSGMASTTASTWPSPSGRAASWSPLMPGS